MRRHGFLTALTALLVGASFGANSFRVTPYVQHPKPDAMTVMWLAQEAGDASITYWKVGSSDKTTLSATERNDLSSDDSGIRFKTDDALEYCQAPELGYNMDPDGKSGDAQRGGGWDLPATVPWQYRVRLTGLEADTTYGYRVQLADGASYENTFRTSPDPEKWRGFKFIYFSDSETQPEDNTVEKGYTTDWDIPEGSPRTSAKYFATQTEAYAANLRAAVDFGTELIVMAGDLAQRGSRQCDWDEFWRHNAGPLNDPAASIPILASPGNHDYWSYNDGGNVGIAKYLSYFEYEPNKANVGVRQHELFHRVDYGPVTFLFMDACNGNDDIRSQDTSLELHRTDADGSNNGCIAPDFNPGSEMYRWLEEQLKDAQTNSAFTFVVCHQCPYSCGYHGGEIGVDDTQTGRALRVLEPLFHKYGVDGWLCGHDEMMERSEISGTETLPTGEVVPHKFCVWDMGIAGDGLRGAVVYNNVNPMEKYRAHVNCPEVWEDGVLVEGGKHYGHLEVTIDQTADGRWRATFDPVYVFFTKDKSGKTVYGGVRHYADKVVRISNRRKGDPPAPQPVVKSGIDLAHYVPTAEPHGLTMTFYDGPLSRGFAWQTDTSVSATTLWLLKGEYDQDDGQVFVDNGTCVTGTVSTVNDPTMNWHRVAVTGLEKGATYSYRLGGGGHYAYGRFTVKDVKAEVTILNLNDIQPKDATLFYKAENTAAVALRTVGGADKVDLLVNGGDFINQNTFKNAGHAVYTQTQMDSYNHLRWGMSADAMWRYFADVPVLFSPGTHDNALYRDAVAINYPSVVGLRDTDAGCQSVDYGSVHIATIPLAGNWWNSEVQLRAAVSWLDADLKRAANAKWKVVCMHWGPYTTGDHGVYAEQDGSPQYTRLITPVLSSNHVDLVMQAHDHTYSKTLPYRWDTAGYASSTTDGTVLNLAPETTTVGGEVYDLNPQSTYYVSAGAAGHRVGEDEKGYSKNIGTDSYTHRDPVIAIGTVSVASSYKQLGEYSSGDFAKQMFGVLKVEGAKLAYDFYVAEEDGTSTLVDKLRICKPGTSSDKGFSVLLK